MSVMVSGVSLKGSYKIQGSFFFLRLALAAIREGNNQRDEDGLIYARK